MSDLTCLASLTDPASDAFPITPSDTAIIAARALYVGADGNVTVTTLQGVDVAFNAVPAGSILPVRVKRVKQNGTTAASIVGLV